MRQRRGIADIEQSLGFKTIKGLAKQHNTFPVIRALLSAIDEVKVTYKYFGAKELRSSFHFDQDIGAIFRRLGPELWPDRGIQRTGWLMDATSAHNAHYPRDLYFQDGQDREILWEGLRAMIFQKVIRHTENEKHNNRHVTARSLSTSEGETSDVVNLRRNEAFISSRLALPLDTDTITTTDMQRDVSFLPATSYESHVEIDHPQTDELYANVHVCHGWTEGVRSNSNGKARCDSIEPEVQPPDRNCLSSKRTLSTPPENEGNVKRTKFTFTAGDNVSRNNNESTSTESLEFFTPIDGAKHARMMYISQAGTCVQGSSSHFDSFLDARGIGNWVQDGVNKMSSRAETSTEQEASPETLHSTVTQAITRTISGLPTISETGIACSYADREDDHRCEGRFSETPFRLLVDQDKNSADEQNGHGEGESLDEDGLAIEDDGVGSGDTMDPYDHDAQHENADNTRLADVVVPVAPMIAPHGTSDQLGPVHLHDSASEDDDTIFVSNGTKKSMPHIERLDLMASVVGRSNGIKKVKQISPLQHSRFPGSFDVTTHGTALARKQVHPMTTGRRKLVVILKITPEKLLPFENTQSSTDHPPVPNTCLLEKEGDPNYGERRQTITDAMPPNAGFEETIYCTKGKSNTSLCTTIPSPAIAKEPESSEQIVSETQRRTITASDTAPSWCLKHARPAVTCYLRRFQGLSDTGSYGANCDGLCSMDSVLENNAVSHNFEVETQPLAIPSIEQTQTGMYLYRQESGKTVPQSFTSPVVEPSASAIEIAKGSTSQTTGANITASVKNAATSTQIVEAPVYDVSDYQTSANEAVTSNSVVTAISVQNTAVAMAEPVGAPINTEMHPDQASIAQPVPQETALERAKIIVYFDSNLQNRAFLRLRRCKTHKHLFEQLYRRRPEDFAHKEIKAVKIRLMNADCAGVTEKPDCTIMDDDEEAFEDFTEILKEYAPDVNPKLHFTVEYWD